MPNAKITGQKCLLHCSAVCRINLLWQCYVRIVLKEKEPSQVLVEYIVTEEYD